MVKHIVRLSNVFDTLLSRKAVIPVYLGHIKENKGIVGTGEGKVLGDASISSHPELTLIVDVY